MGLEEGVEPCADGEEGYGDHDRHQSVGQDAAGSAALVLRGEVALYDGLVAGIGNEVVGQSAEDDHPEGGAPPVEAPDEHAELVVGRGDVEEAAGTAARVGDEIDGGQHGAAHEDDALDDVAPHHGLHAAHGAIDDGDDRHEHNADVDVNARYGRHGQRGQEDDQCRAGHHEHDEEQRGHEARGIVETALQILVGRGHVEPAEEGQVILYDGEGNEQYADLHGIVGPVGGIGLGGDAHVGDGAEHGGEYADACRPPRYAAAALEEVFTALLTVHEVNAQQYHAHEVEHQHQPVEPAEGGRVGHLHIGHVGRAHAGLLFTADDGPVGGPERVFVCHHGGSGAGKGRVSLNGAP